MALELIKYKYAISYCEIPEDLTNDLWIAEFQNGCYVVYSLEIPENYSAFDQWIIDTYPELKDEDTILIHMDY